VIFNAFAITVCFSALFASGGANIKKSVVTFLTEWTFIDAVNLAAYHTFSWGKEP
jgi:hypothetical protein